MELFLFRGGYGGLSLVEDGIANLCLVVRRNTLRRLGGWAELLHSMQSELPALHDRLTNATPCWPKPLAISPIPYGHLGGPAMAYGASEIRRRSSRRSPEMECRSPSTPVYSPRRCTSTATAPTNTSSAWQISFEQACALHRDFRSHGHLRCKSVCTPLAVADSQCDSADRAFNPNPRTCNERRHSERTGPQT